MEITAYKCEHCNTIHSTKNKYNSCFKKCAKEKLEAIKREEREKNFLALSDEVRLNLTDIRDLGKELSRFFKKHYRIDIDITTKVDELREISNSHKCPIGERTNWNRDKNYPTSFLGWSGNISAKFNGNIKIKHPLRNENTSSYSDLLDMWRGIVRGINTGCGGGGNNSFSYGLELFLQDFPKINKLYKEYSALEERKKKYDQERLRLTNSAIERMIDCDEKVKMFKKQVEMARIIQTKSGNAIENRKSEIFGSNEYKEAIKVSKEYEFDIYRYDEIKNNFGK